MFLVLVLVVLLLLISQVRALVSSIFSVIFKVIVFILNIRLEVIWIILKYVLRVFFSCLGWGRRVIRAGMPMPCYSISYVCSILEYNHRAQVQYPYFCSRSILACYVYRADFLLSYPFNRPAGSLASWAQSFAARGGA